MRVLIVHYSRTGHTARLADARVSEIRQRGHEVATEAIRVKRDWNKWLLPIPLLPLLPLLPVYFMSERLRRFWHGIYRQQEQAIWPHARRFTLDGEIGQAGLKRFCDKLMAP
jgi:hypothetical protein